MSSVGINGDIGEPYRTTPVINGTALTARDKKILSSTTGGDGIEQWSVNYSCFKICSQMSGKRFVIIYLTFALQELEK